jgi:hypothetical protein
VAIFRLGREGIPFTLKSFQCRCGRQDLESTVEKMNDDYNRTPAFSGVEVYQLEPFTFRGNPAERLKRVQI